jgi:hypothetical protein
MFIYILENVLTLAICLLAFRSGDMPERLAGLWLAANISVYALIATHEGASATLSLINDGVYSVGLLPLAMIYVSWGIGVMTLIQACSFAIQAFYLLSDRAVDQTYLVLTNIAAIGVTLTLLGSTVASILHRRAQARTPGRPQPVEATI